MESENTCNVLSGSFVNLNTSILFQVVMTLSRPNQKELLIFQMKRPSVDFVPVASQYAYLQSPTKTGGFVCAHWNSLRRRVTIDKADRMTLRKHWRTWRMLREK